MRWRIILPIAGLLLFAGETYESVRMNHRWNSPRYFWWSFVRLDADPLNRHRPVVPSCREAAENCNSWDLPLVIVDPGGLAKLVVWSGLPAFAFGSVIVLSLGRLGINEIWSFMISMPLLLLSWYYF